MTTINPRAGQLANSSELVDVPKLITAYFELRPDPQVPEQRVAFGTSGHRGSSFDSSFNEWHILAITQAICLYRKQQKWMVPCFWASTRIRFHAPPWPARLKFSPPTRWRSCWRRTKAIRPRPPSRTPSSPTTRAANPALQTASWSRPRTILRNRGGFKYNPHAWWSGDPAMPPRGFEAKANEFLKAKLEGVKRIAYKNALAAPTDA